ncbi:MAG: Hpt domain-containing protein, partial [Treponema sp.]|nr:Hpt domain-containing protein [Treponema sp.]
RIKYNRCLFMTVKEFYDSIGSDYNAALARLMDDGFIMKLLGKFKADQNYANLQTTLAAGDGKAAFVAAHTLKGLALNMGMDALGNAASELTEALRGDSPDVEKGKSLLPAVVSEYGKVEEALKGLLP